jgi:early secretory antigenic target protein ESAT-6
VTDRLRVVFGSLSELTDGLLETANALEDHLSELDDAVTKIAASWEGEAHDRFHQRVSEWRTTSRALHRALRGLHRLTETAHGNYAAAEAANLRMWGAA